MALNWKKIVEKDAANKSSLVQMYIYINHTEHPTFYCTLLYLKVLNECQAKVF